MPLPDTSNVVDRARSATGQAADGRWVERVARYGLVAKGVSYGLVGVLAGALALDVAGKATSREGALQVIADETWGKAIIVALAIGFASYGFWRLVQAFFDRENEGDGLKGLAKRATYLGRAFLYGFLTWTALRLLANSGGSESQTEEAQKATAQLLDWPAGRFLVGLVGLTLIGVGVFNGYRAFTQKFEENWDMGKMSATEKRWGPRISSAGLLARFVVFSLLGIFLVKAAYEFDADEAIGLDGALRKVAQASYGPVLLGIVAAGLVCYALYCFVEARYRRV